MSNKVRIFHINSLPPKNIFILLKPKFGRTFFSQILVDTTENEVARRIGLKEKLLHLYIKGYNLSSKNPVFIRLNILLKLASLYRESINKLDILTEIEKNIQAIRGYGRSGVLKNPKLPFLEDKHLIRFLVHMIGDGRIPQMYGSPEPPNYTNTSQFLREQFISCLSNVFGDITNCIRHEIHEKASRSRVTFSKWIAYILQNWYPDAKFDYVNGSLPSVFFDLPLGLKAEMVRAFGDDDGHVGAHSIRFTSGGSTILGQMRRLVLELMEATMSIAKYNQLLQSVGEVKPFRNWFIFDLYRPLYEWYAAQVGFTHPERAERLRFQLECDRVWVDRGLDGFDLDFLTLIRLREPGSVQDVAQRFVLREDFLFKVIPRLRKLGWIEPVKKEKFTTLYQTTGLGEQFLARTLGQRWGVGDRVVMQNAFWLTLREALLAWFGTAAAVARATGIPETTVRGYLQGRRQWMHAKWVVALTKALGWGRDVVSEGVVVALVKEVAPRYEQCDFLVKDLGVYRRFSLAEIGFDSWLVHRCVPMEREVQLLDVGFAEKLQSASAIRSRIIELTRGQGGEITLAELKADSVLRGLVADRYPVYVADRMAKLVKQGVFRRVKKGCYQLVAVSGR